MASGFWNIGKIPELRKRLIFTVVLLAVYRIGIFITTPGVDRVVMHKYVSSQRGTLLGFINFFSGGALEQLSIFALGIMPYISASIILQLLTVVVPTLERLQKEGEQGRQKITQYTRYGAVLIAIAQGFSIAVYLEGLKVDAARVVSEPSWGFRLLTVLTLTAGTAFLMWLGEQITERGIGNGTSLIIFAGIVARLPQAVAQTVDYVKNDLIQPVTMLGLTVLMVGVIAAIIFFERGQRRIPVQYARRLVGRKMYGGLQSHLPLKVNSSGVIPPIFASSVLMFPATVGNLIQAKWMEDLQRAIQPGGLLYNVLFAGLIMFFCYFYTAVSFNPIDVADNMKKNGGYIPGIRPGKKTAEYIDHVLSRITFGGALYISAICLLPSLLADNFKVPFYFGGTGLLIVVGVALDTVNQIESHLITRHYDGFAGAKGPRIRGRRAS
ncbi:MAG: preprotein translocase subunit SecY [Deltaproteobacteria bacterium]|nr:preprotein translocase subunit SecY [Deltaproteobacteria bacterium]